MGKIYFMEQGDAMMLEIEQSKVRCLKLRISYLVVKLLTTYNQYQGSKRSIFTLL